MAIGTYFGAGGVKNLYRCYIGAGGLKTVTGIYAGVGGVKRVWPSGLIYDAGIVYEPLTWNPYTYSGTEWMTLNYGSSYMTFTNRAERANAAFHASLLYTTSTLDMSLYSTLSVTYRVTSLSYGVGNAPYFYIGVDTTTNNTRSAFDAVLDLTLTSSDVSTSFQTVTLNISSITSSEYVKILFYNMDTSTLVVDINHIELS